MMKALSRKHYLFLMALGVTLFCGPIDRAEGGEINYLFDFNDKKIPDVLRVTKQNWGDTPTASLTYSATTGRLEIRDARIAATAVNLNLPQEVTDAHLSAVINPQGGTPRGVPYLIARDRYFMDRDDSYWCFLWPFSDGSKFTLTLTKNVNGKEVFHVDTVEIPGVPTGPYLIQFDVVDGVSATGKGYTDLRTRLTDKNNVTRSNSFRDWDGVAGLGGYSRITSGQVDFGAGVSTDHRDRGWALNVPFDDVSIRVTPVPEPCTLLLLSAGTAGLLALAWQRRKRAA
jgi:hypothetical protein